MERLRTENADREIEGREIGETAIEDREIGEGEGGWRD